MKTALKTSSKRKQKSSVGTSQNEAILGLSPKSIKALKELVKEKVVYGLEKQHLPLEKAFMSEVCEAAAHIPTVDLKILGKYGLVEEASKVSVVTCDGVKYNMHLPQTVLVPLGFFSGRIISLSIKASKYVEMCAELSQTQKEDRQTLVRMIEEASSWDEVIDAWPIAETIRPSKLAKGLTQ